jgi:hypothetical protein
MVVGFTTTCAISAYHHWSCEFDPCSWRGVLDTTLYDKVFQWLATGRWFSPGTPVSSTNKTGCHDITEILLKVALNTINQPTNHKNVDIYFNYSDYYLLEYLVKNHNEVDIDHLFHSLRPTNIKMIWIK